MTKKSDQSNEPNNIKEGEWEYPQSNRFMESLKYYHAEIIDDNNRLANSRNWSIALFLATIGGWLQVLGSNMNFNPSSFITKYLIMTCVLLVTSFIILLLSRFSLVSYSGTCNNLLKIFNIEHHFKVGKNLSIEFNRFLTVEEKSKNKYIFFCKFWGYLMEVIFDFHVISNVVLSILAYLTTQIARSEGVIISLNCIDNINFGIYIITILTIISSIVGTFAYDNLHKQELHLFNDRKKPYTEPKIYKFLKQVFSF